jgi:hypothetical protein
MGTDQARNGRQDPPADARAAHLLKCVEVGAASAGLIISRHVHVQIVCGSLIKVAFGPFPMPERVESQRPKQ